MFRTTTICSPDIVPVLIILHMSSIEDTLKPNWLATTFTKLVRSVALRLCVKQVKHGCVYICC